MLRIMRRHKIMCQLVRDNDPPIGTNNLSLCRQLVLMQLRKESIVTEDATLRIKGDSVSSRFKEDVHSGTGKVVNVADLVEKDSEIVK